MTPNTAKVQIRTKQSCRVCKKPYREFHCVSCDTRADRFYLHFDPTRYRIYSFNGYVLRQYEHAKMLADALEKTTPVYLYFLGIKHHDERWTKIGITCNIQRRIKHLQNASPFEIELIAHVMAHPSVERRLHRYFHEYRRRGEWFVGEKVHQFAEDIKKGIYGVPTDIDDLMVGTGVFNIGSKKCTPLFKGGPG